MGLNLLRLFKTAPDKPLGGRYKIISHLGAGGFGQTFLAEDMHLPEHPRCVVKQLKPQVSDPASLQTARRLFDMEAKVLYQLGNHDQIPRLLAHFEENQEFYLAQELIEGEPLTHELVPGQPWSEARVIALLQDLLYVLAFVHQQHVIHRDIKPSNLIRRRHDSRIVLIDFGAVKQASTQLVNPQSGQTRTISIGTQGYTPKEQLGGNPRFSSDVYAVGIIGIQALTGIHPRHLREDPQTGEISWRVSDLAGRAPQVSPELAAILECMVRYDFRTRYPTAAEALEALRMSELAASPELPQELSEATTAPSQELQPLPGDTNSTVSGTDVSSTNIWVPTEHSGEPLPSASTGSTAYWPNSQLSKQSQSSAPTIATPGLTQRKSVKLWPVAAVLAVVGATFLIAKPLLFHQSPSQTAELRGVSAASPTASPAEESPQPAASSAAPSPLVSPGEESPPTPATAAPSPGEESPPTPATAAPSPKTSPTEKPPQPASASPPAPSLSTNPSVKSPQAAASPPAATQASPPPAAPPPESQVAGLLNKAERLRKAKQYQKAIKLYDQALARKQDIAEAHWGRCYSLNSLQQPEDALIACNEALALNPSYPEALWSKGNALDQQQRHIDALQLYEQATAFKPDFAEAWNNRGVALQGLGRFSEAVAAFDRAIAIKPDFADAWANRGAAFWELRSFNQAIASIDKALQIQPDNRNAINLRQQVREKLGR